MKRIVIAWSLASLTLVAFTASETFGRGGRGGGGGGARVGGYGGAGGGPRPAVPNVGAQFGGGAINSYGGGGGNVQSHSVSPVVGPRGGTGNTAKGSGSITTKGGSTIDYKGAAIGGTTPGGISGGKYIGGVNVTTPGGKEISHVGRGSGAVGPGGNAVGKKSGTTVATGPGGSFASHSNAAGVMGPNGAAGVKTKAGVASTPNGLYGGVTRAGVGTGSYGAVAGKTTVGVGPGGTYYRSTTAIRGQGAYIRTSVGAYPCFRPSWYSNHPGAWYAAGWATANTAWRWAAWNNLVGYGYPATPVYYDYGDNIVYQDNSVYIDGEPAYTAEEFSQQASDLAEAGRKAEAPKDDEWMPLGVFAMVQGDEKTSNHVYQLALNKKNIVRGTYYDAVTDMTYPVEGSVNPRTQRAAFTVGGRKTPVYDVGIANLTQEATTMMVHYGDRSAQFTLIRLPEPQEGEAKEGEAPRQ